MKKGLVDLFKSKTIEDIVGQGRNILYLKEDTPLKYALQELMKRDVRFLKKIDIDSFSTFIKSKRIIIS